MELAEIARIRLDQIGKGAVEAAVAAGLERTFIRDLIEGKKSAVRSDKLSDLARALGLDAQALSDGRLVPLTVTDPEAEEISRIMARLPEEARDQLLGRARSLDLQFPGSSPVPKGSSDPRGGGDA